MRQLSEKYFFLVNGDPTLTIVYNLLLEVVKKLNLLNRGSVNAKRTYESCIYMLKYHQLKRRYQERHTGHLRST